MDPLRYNEPYRNVFGEYSKNLTTPPAIFAVDELLQKELQEARDLLYREPSLAPFRDLSDTLLSLIWAEKKRVALVAETRSVYDDQGVMVTGYQHHYDAVIEELYHPRHFAAFPIKAVWLPLEAGELFSLLPNDSDSPLRRCHQGQEQLLFFIHPKSEELFKPLLQKYAKDEIVASALALSSFRTLCIALPGIQRKYVMIKVSLDATIGGVVRRLTRRECILSVANTELLRKETSKLQILQEPLSFVPKEMNAGMIYRPIPPEWLDPNSCQRVIPLFSLFGWNNRDMLLQLVTQSGKTATAFITEYLLDPIATHWLTLLFESHCSLEIHGQNLLLLIDRQPSGTMTIELCYRDMGGVNLLPSAQARKALPSSLRQEECFYTKSHCQDGANVLEDFACKVAFALTKQLVKNSFYEEQDPLFAQWKMQMEKRGFLANWTMGREDDEHKREYAIEQFYRYGYCEKLFGHKLLEELSRRAIFLELDDPDISYGRFAEELADPHSCIERLWFFDLISKVYGRYIELFHP